MAVHGALIAGDDAPPRQGYLTSVRSVTLHVACLDDVPGELDVHAERLSGDGNHILYQFRLDHAGRCLLEGRAAVVLDAEAL
jgi:predicted hotdog family 3-hydroxylacyl-ACP dehydratase